MACLFLYWIPAIFISMRPDIGAPLQRAAGCILGIQ
jgi:hypothetical protein